MKRCGYLEEPIANPRDWQAMADHASNVVIALQAKPRSQKAGYRLSPGSILNAYREGDLTFARAVKALERWRRVGL